MTSISDQATLVDRFTDVRGHSERIAEPLEVEDMVVQSMPDVSPTKWHLAHTTWFFETFVLKQDSSYEVFDEAFEVLFNSYYNSVGEQFSRPHRGLLSRPTVPEVFAYRRHVDAQLAALLSRGVDDETARVVEIGLHHEQQHQELMLTDIKHVLSINPLDPVYSPRFDERGVEADEPDEFLAFDGGLVDVGHGGDGFAYDNEGPRHQALVQPFAIGSRLVTNGDWMGFIDDDGYRRPEFWTSLGWSVVESEGWDAPDYWRSGSRWTRFGLCGRESVATDEPVAHVSWLEADAYARWRSLVEGDAIRLPTEFEWEIAATPGAGLPDAFGSRWQWTSSPYTPYPGYRAADGALGEYNGKFMTQQYVLRGSSVATSPGHSRPTYRNFFPPEARWQFTGLRLAKDLS